MFNFWQRTEWRRLRYSEATLAADALNRVRQVFGYPIELRWRVVDGVAQLFIGVPADGRRNPMLALEKMAPAFGLWLEQETTIPKPLTGALTPGDWSALTAGNMAVDARITLKDGMTVRGLAPLEAPMTAPVSVQLPTPTVGIHAAPDLPFPVYAPDGAAWHLGEGGIHAPAGVIGEATAQRTWLVAVGRASFGNGRATVVIDGGDGQLAAALRSLPDVAEGLRSGRILDLRLSRAGQQGFNPFTDAPDPEATVQRWIWFWREGNVDAQHLSRAHASGVRSLTELEAYFRRDVDMKVSAHAVKRFMTAEQGVLGAWTSGTVNVVRHLQDGGHILVDIPHATGARLRAVRGIVGLALESGARLLSNDTRWPTTDDPILEVLDALCGDRYWQRMAFTRCAKPLAQQTAVAHGEPMLREYLQTLPEGVALANEGDSWWMLKA